MNHGVDIVTERQTDDDGRKPVAPPYKVGRAKNWLQCNL